MFARSASPPLTRDSASRFLPWIIALMIFVAALALAGVMVLGVAVDRWDRGLTGSLTVQVPPGTTNAETEARVGRVVEVLRGSPAVAAAAPLSPAEIADLLTPWLGQGAAVEELPLPRLIDVRLADRTGSAPGIGGMLMARLGIDDSGKRAAASRAALDDLAARLARAAPGTVIDDHQSWLNGLVRYARVLEVAAVATLALITAVAVATIVFVTLTRMSIHREVIDLLHLMGATNRYVARQFERHALVLGLGGGLLGLAGAGTVLLALDWAAVQVAGMLLPAPRLAAWQWGVLAALPIATGLVAMITARATVLARLRRVP